MSWRTKLLYALVGALTGIAFSTIIVLALAVADYQREINARNTQDALNRMFRLDPLPTPYWNDPTREHWGERHYLPPSLPEQPKEFRRKRLPL